MLLHYEEAMEAEFMRDYRAWLRSEAAFKQQWPNHCRLCGAYGIRVQVNELEVEEEKCECLLNGHCPRCNSIDLRNDNHIECGNCGWTEAAGGCPTF